MDINFQKICLRYGILSETFVAFDNIETIRIFSNDIEKNTTTKHLSPIGELGGHNMIIQLKNENTLTSLYGFKQKYTTLVFFVDKKMEFYERVNTIIQQMNK